jgi:spore maturation protein CgeB
MRILYAGELSSGSTSRMRADTLEALGHKVHSISTNWSAKSKLTRALQAASYRIGFPVDGASANKRLLQLVPQLSPEALWIDKGLVIKPSTLRRLKKIEPRMRIVSYAVDDMYARHNQSRYYVRSVPIYDLHITTKSYNVHELKQLGARHVAFVDNAYDPSVHRPMQLSNEEREWYGSPVGFIGTYEEDRAAAILALAQEGLRVKVWGNGWRKMTGAHNLLAIMNQALLAEEYAKAICAFDINLCFLRKMNRDVQTQRSVEIPACGSFMLAERTNEHQRLFREGVEAEFFGSTHELVTKCKRYLDDPQSRGAVAAAGRNRVLGSGYSYRDQLSHVLRLVQAEHSRAAASSLAGVG